MAKDEGVLRADLELARYTAAATRRNLKHASPELVGYWLHELEEVNREVARLERELATLSEASS